jgi:hypothetical protein
MGLTKWQRWDEVERFLEKKGKIVVVFDMSLVGLHNGNVQHNHLSINNIMLYWELNGSLKIEICNLGCTL